MKPFLKWAGGKYRVMGKISPALSKGKRLIEPFAGSGAVFLNTDYDDYLINDLNPDLINTFKFLQTEGREFIYDVKKLFTPENNNESIFYDLRSEFNSTCDLRRKSTIFIYINRHCFNGLCRYNKKGGFNVPFGSYKAPYFPEDEMIFFHQKSKNVQFTNVDFTETLGLATTGDIVYCDPPYVPLTVTSNFTSYTQDGFSRVQQIRLAELAMSLMARDIPVIISNHDTEFTRDAYASALIQAFEVQRNISSKGTQRNKANELLAVFQKELLEIL